jgi:predicted TIM-barrel fold metal-dependent hydrolase
VPGQQLAGQLRTEAGAVWNRRRVAHRGNVVEVGRQLDDLRVGAETFRQRVCVLGHYGQMLIEEGRTEDILAALAFLANRFTNDCSQHVATVS